MPRMLSFSFHTFTLSHVPLSFLPFYALVSFLYGLHVPFHPHCVIPHLMRDPVFPPAIAGGKRRGVSDVVCHREPPKIATLRSQ